MHCAQNGKYKQTSQKENKSDQAINVRFSTVDNHQSLNQSIISMGLIYVK